MAVKAVCTTACYTGKQFWEPGMIRIFPSKKEIEPCFAYTGEVEELKEGPPSKSFSQLTIEEYVALAKENDVEIPAECKTKEDIKKFLIEKGLDKK